MSVQPIPPDLVSMLSNQRTPWQFESEVSEKLKISPGSLHKKYNAHYIPVIPSHSKSSEYTTYYPCAKEQEPTCDEIVVFQPAQSLFRFWVKTEVAILPNPKLLLSGFTIQELSEEILHRLQNAVITENPNNKALALHQKKLPKLLKINCLPF